MKCLVINTLAENDENIIATLKIIENKFPDLELIQTAGMNLKGCAGCRYCWLKTPGKCVIEDDYEEILKKILKTDYVVFIAQTKLGFVTYQMKNIVDRLLPLTTPYLTFQNGESRHLNRYAKSWKFALLYTGASDKDFLNEWLARVALNLHSKSSGAFLMEESEVLTYEFDNL